MRTVYIVGAPGSGKSSALACALNGVARFPQSYPISHEVLARSVGGGWDTLGAELGRHRTGFSGTDALGMNVQPAAIKFVQSQPYPLLLGEGDRLATDGFLEACAAAGELVVVHLCTTLAIAEARREKRGSHQNPSWVKGRITKVERLLDRWPHEVVDGDASLYEVGHALRELIGLSDLL